MNGQAYIALSLAFIALGSIIIAPLAQFVYEESLNPQTFVLIPSYEQYNSTHVEVTFIISYNGSVPLNDVSLSITLGQKTIQSYKERLQKGDSANIKAYISVKDVEKITSFEAKIRFTIAELYPIEVKVVRA
ncbi:MAG: hypothetical protein H5T50_01820 [Nitrososphaeria archaeon]|nr:hypothetical protein [Nitrososphaeria archaeon]